MADLPSGTVTFLFTDIEGSTARWERDPLGMQACLARHTELLGQAIERWRGRVFKRVGDGTCAVFGSAVDALQAALSAQRALGGEPWPEDDQLLVRMAIHTGIAQPQEADYLGPPLNLVARLLAAGHGGQILLSEAARQVVGDQLLAEVEILDLGEHRLKDIVRAERIYQVAAPDLRREFPPLSTLERRLHNLPLPRTSLVGRERELAAAKRLLLDAATGLVTLTGSPGSGKTRLAVHLASEVAGSFSDGVFFVALAPVRDPDALPSSIANALGLHPSPAQIPSDALLGFLRQKQLLLVLDNFEQLVAAAPTVAGLLEGCPKLKVLATSRAALRIRAEREFHLSPLPVPDPGAPPPPAEIVSYPSVELFVQRASTARPGFQLDQASAGAVAAICRRLDGLPLAIELAAARIQLLTPAEILSRLEGGSDLLTLGPRDLPERQRTLRQAIAWSYDLLDPDAQRLFRGLGVFVGGFTLEMGEEVCGAEAEDHRSGGERGYGLVLDTLGILVENHLVERADVTGGGEAPRFGMLETIRDYAQERLASSGEAAVFRRRHAEAFVRLGEEANPELDGAHQRTWLKRLDAEAHNIHAALGWCLEKGEPELGLRLGGAIFKFWSKRGHAEDGRRLDELLEKGGAVAAAVRAKALNAAAYMAYNRGDLAHAEELLEEAVALRRELGDRSATAKTLANLGMMVTYRGDYPRARRLLEETLELLRSLGEKSGVANDLLNLGIVASYEGDLEAAVGFFEEGLDIFRALGDIWSIATTQQDLGSALLHRGDYARAREQLDEAIELFGSLDDSHGVAQVKLNRGALALCEGDAALATSLLREALSRLDEVGDRRALTACLDGLAQAAAATGDAARAARLMGSAETLRAVGGFPWAPGEKALRDGARARVRILLGEETMNAAWAEGAALPLANAVAEALGVQAPVASGRMPA